MLVRGVQEECFQVFFTQEKAKLDHSFGISFGFQNICLRAAIFYNCIMLNLSFFDFSFVLK